MSYSELVGMKRKFGYSSAMLHVTTQDEDLIGKSLSLIGADGYTYGTGVFNSDGIADIPTLLNGKGTLECEYAEGEKATTTVSINNYKTYNVDLAKYHLYEFRINKNDSNPATRVEYLNDTAELTPAHMDYAAGTFDYGSWENAFFMPKPCMLTYSGKVDYFLDPDDYTKTEDGEASDVANTSYSGNAMVQFPLVWLNIRTAGNYIYVSVCDKKLDSSYEAYAHHGQDGSILPYVYMPIYNGSLISNRIRSISGQSIMNGQTGTNEITYAKANGDYWDTEVLADRMLVNMLLILMGKSTNTQTVFGNGHYTGGSGAGLLLATGTMNTRGLFWGTNSTGSGVKVFGMENWWGNQWRRIRGWINASGTQKIKMTYGTEDGSTTTGYNTDGSGYITLSGATPAGTNGGYINACLGNQYGIFPYQASGSETTYECDGLWFNNSQTNYACVGGVCDDGWLVGAFCADLSSAVSHSHWYIGASLSCKPPVS